jgi:hypothetical protein
MAKLDAQSPFKSIAITDLRRLSDYPVGTRRLNPGIILESALFYENISIDVSFFKRFDHDEKINSNREILLDSYKGKEESKIYEYIETQFSHDYRISNDIVILNSSVRSFDRHPVVIVQPEVMLEHELSTVEENGLKPLDFAHYVYRSYGSDILSQLDRILSDKLHSAKIVDSILRSLVPTFPAKPDLYFYGSRSDERIFSIHSNVDFTGLSKHLSAQSNYSYIYRGGTSVCFIIDKLVEVCVLKYKMAYSTQSIRLPAFFENIMATEFQSVFFSNDQIDAFARYVLDGRCIAEAINNGTITLHDYILLHEKSRDFKKWISNQAVDGYLVKHYLNEISGLPTLERLPSKSIRFSITTGVGVTMDMLGAGGIGTAVGASIGAIDTFVLSRIFRGWRPSIFVGELLKALPR